MIVNVPFVPEQVVPNVINCGVTVMVPTIAAGLVLAATKDGKLPDPELANPIFALEFCQIKEEPVTVPLNGITGVTSALQ